MRGLILAGGLGSRLWPVTSSVSKHLLPVYDKPMIYYPLSVLLLAGIRNILVISTPWDTPRFQHLLGDGSKWGIDLSYAVQTSPQGLAQAVIIGSEFIGNRPSALILGDNLFHGGSLEKSLQSAVAITKGARILGYRVPDPERYGVVTLDEAGQVCDLEEKPIAPKSSLAVTGLYFYDSTVSARARTLTPSARGELEITDLNRTYLDDRSLGVEVLDPKVAWFDAGTSGSLLTAAKYMETVEREQGRKVCCPEEICWRMGNIDDLQLERLADEFRNNEYGAYLGSLLEEKP